jgi:hypothetical protein
MILSNSDVTPAVEGAASGSPAAVSVTVAAI